MLTLRTLPSTVPKQKPVFLPNLTLLPPRKHFPRQKAPITVHRREMSDIKTISTPNAAQPAGPYSQAKVTPIGIFVSGQIPALPDGTLVEGSIGEKTAACIKSLKAILDAAGSSIDRVVKVNIFLSDMAHFTSMNEEYAKWFTTKPARSCVAVKTLPKNVDVEIECIAAPS